MIVIFIIDGNFQVLHFTTSENYSKVLKGMGINPDRATYKTIPLESLIMLLDNQVEHITR